jgi:hypothetical protein
LVLQRLYKTLQMVEFIVKQQTRMNKYRYAI